MLRFVTILLPSFINMFWAIYFLGSIKKNARSQNIWMVTSFLMAVSMAITGYYWFCDGNYGLFYKLDTLQIFLSLLFIPAFFMYFREVTGDTQPLGAFKIILLLLPAVWIGGATALFYLLLGDEQSTLYTQVMMESFGQASLNDIPYRSLLLASNEYVHSTFLVLQAVIVCIYAMRRMALFRSRLDEFFSDVDSNMRHHWAVLWGILVLLLLIFTIAVLGYMLYIAYSIWVSVFGTLLGLTLYFISYHVSLSHYTAADFARDLNNRMLKRCKKSMIRLMMRMHPAMYRVTRMLFGRSSFPNLTSSLTRSGCFCKKASALTMLHTVFMPTARIYRALSKKNSTATLPSSLITSALSMPRY